MSRKKLYLSPQVRTTTIQESPVLLACSPGWSGCGGSNVVCCADECGSPVYNYCAPDEASCGC